MLSLRVDTQEESVVYRLAFAPTGGRLFALVDGGWEFDRLSELHELSLPDGREERVGFVRWAGAFAPDLRWVASVGYQKTAGVQFLVVHDLTATPTRQPPPSDEAVRAVGFQPERIFYRLWEYPSGTLDPCYLGGLSGNLAVSPNARLVAGVGFEDDGVDGVERLRVWNVETGESWATVVPNSTSALAFSPDGRRLVGVRPGGLDVWDVDTLARKTWRRRVTPAGPLAFSPDGQVLAAAVEGTTVTLLDVGDWTTAPTVRAEWLTPATSLLFHPDGRLLTAGHDGVVRLWNSTGGHPIDSFDWSVGPLHSIAIAPDGLTCAVGGEGGRVAVWDV